jgi:hypothetical protein
MPAGRLFAEASRNCFAFRLGSQWQAVVMTTFPAGTPHDPSAGSQTSASPDPAVRQFCAELIEQLRGRGVIPNEPH